MQRATFGGLDGIGPIERPDRPLQHAAAAHQRHRTERLAGDVSGPGLRAISHDLSTIELGSHDPAASQFQVEDIGRDGAEIDPRRARLQRLEAIHDHRRNAGARLRFTQKARHCRPLRPTSGDGADQRDHHEPPPRYGPSDRHRHRHGASALQDCRPQETRAAPCTRTTKWSVACRNRQRRSFGVAPPLVVTASGS